LQALEDEEWFLMPGRAYAKAFLREYADFLGLESDLFVDEYTRHYPPEDEAGMVPERLPAPRSLHISTAAVALGLSAFMLGAWWLGDSGPKAPAAAALELSPAPAVTPQGAQKVAATPPQRHRYLLTVTATRGDCWLEVRQGTTTTFAGTLAKGRTLRFRLGSVWMRIGAPDNLSATLDGKRLQLPGDTADVVFTRAGLRLA
jgi:cytoskeletal protein RodZ